MAYTKQTWSETTPITPVSLNKIETQYDEAKGYTDAHEAKSAPHAGHALASDLSSHKTDATAHAGVLATQSSLDTHVNASAPHSGHATVTALNNHTGSANPHAGVLATQSDLDTHKNASAPHSGHASVTALNNHTSATAPHSGHATTTALNNHTQASAPHAGHVKGTMNMTVSATEPASSVDGDIWIVV
jgi:hypothetical protein